MVIKKDLGRINIVISDWVTFLLHKFVILEPRFHASKQNINYWEKMNKNKTVVPGVQKLM